MKHWQNMGMFWNLHYSAKDKLIFNSFIIPTPIPPSALQLCNLCPGRFSRADWLQPWAAWPGLRAAPALRTGWSPCWVPANLNYSMILSGSFFLSSLCCFSGFPLQTWDFYKETRGRKLRCPIFLVVMKDSVHCRKISTSGRFAYYSVLIKMLVLSNLLEVSQNWRKKTHPSYLYFSILLRNLCYFLTAVCMFQILSIALLCLIHCLLGFPETDL